jgi:hypothetical protein
MTEGGAEDVIASVVCCAVEAAGAAGVSDVCWDQAGAKASRREEARRVGVKPGKTVCFVILILSSVVCGEDESSQPGRVWTIVNLVSVVDMYY